ncbi:hypothetical protein VPH35_090821 [Triticum aestivum]
MEETSMHQDQSPIEQVRLTVPTTDDPTLPTLTLRVWIIGITGCIIMSLVSVMTGFRQNPVGVPNFVVTILCYSLGKFMASVLPSNLRVRGTRIKISINPGPFNIKEHLLSTVIFSSGLGTMPAANLYAATRAYFRISIHPMAFFFLLLTTNSIIYGFAGFFIKPFVNRSEMWWPEVLPDVTMFSPEVYDVYGGRYNLSRVLDGSSFQFKQDGYESYSELYLSIARACSIGFGFAALASSLTNIVLSHGRSFWNQLSQSTERRGCSDIHMQMMNKYRSIPMWWFIRLTISMIGLAVFTCEGFGNELQLPYWGVLLACLLVLTLVPPLAALRATACQQPPLSLFAHIIIGYFYPGRPLANMVFNLYSTWCIEYTLGTLASFKLGIYMKIPPRELFFAQVIGTFLATTSDFVVTWWLFSTVKDLCRTELLPRGSPWTCPSTRMIYNEMVVWGLIGPRQMFFKGVYSKLVYFFLIGNIAPIPVWILARRFPEKKWIKLILVPVLFMPGAKMPPARAVNYICWFVLGFIFNYIIFRRWERVVGKVQLTLLRRHGHRHCCNGIIDDVGSSDARHQWRQLVGFICL